jgi:hypothetical protein
MPRSTKIRYNTIKAAVPAKPHSSANTAKMKSVLLREEVQTALRPSHPLPQNPPEPMAIFDCQL